MKDRTTIGLYVGSLEENFCQSVFRGACMAAEEKDVNLVVFPGKYLYKDEDIDTHMPYEYQYNTLFSYGGQECIDVLAVCVGTICTRGTMEMKKKFLEKMQGKKTLIIASNEENYSCIQYDNKTGIHEGIAYLVKEQHCTKIGMIAGTSTNQEAVERLEAYKESLIENGLTFDETMVTFGDLTDRSEASAAELMDRHPELEAIICVNDDTAKAAYKVLSSRGIRIGEDIMILGFDDIPDCVRMNPPLATIRADATDLGYEAVLTCMRMMEDDEPQKITLSTKFIPRESVRYAPYNVSTLLNRFSGGQTNTIDVPSVSRGLTEFIFRNIHHDYQSECQKKVMLTFFERLLGRFFDGVIKRNSDDDILRYFKNMVERGIMVYVDYRKIFQVFDTIYQIFCSQNKILSTRLEFHNLLNNLQQTVVEYMCVMIQSSERKNYDMYHTTNCVTRDILMLNDETEQSYPNSIAQMYMLGIQNSYLFVWDKPIEYQRGDTWNPPPNILLKTYQRKEEAFPVPRTSQKISVRKLLEHKYFDKTERYSMVVLDIFSQSLQLGLYVCDLGLENLHYIEYITYQLSTAIRILNLFQLQRITGKKLEESMEKLQANNIALDTMSKTDELTGIYNRRGFYMAAEELLKKSTAEECYVVVCYADMDKLKMVNDTYGHDEGDYSLCSCAKILQRAMKDKGIVGRIGGDEFCAIALETKDNQEMKYRDRIKAVTQLINSECEKPYKIELSVGIAEFLNREDVDLQAMIDETDDLLYVEKKNK